MSHHKERVEKECLNCGTAPLIDRYCQHCGQENVEPKQSIWHLVTHVFNDITHFDGKFFSTMKLLLLKPGFLSGAYLRGQRTSYLDPIRMYLFISTFFFVFTYFSSGDNEMKMDRVSVIHDREIMTAIDTMRIKKSVDNFEILSEDLPDYERSVVVLNVYYNLRHGVKHYDSLVKTGTDKDSWFTRFRNRRLAAIYEAYDAEPYNFFPELIDRFRSSLSKIFFISLPIFAFLLYVLNIRHRRQYYYVSHAIFSMHYYSVVFLFLIPIVYVTNHVEEYKFFYNLQGVLILGVLLYLFVAMKRFYKQGWIKTFLKFAFLSFFTFISIFVIALGLLLTAFMSMAGSH